MVAEVVRVGLEAERYTVLHAATPEAGIAVAAQQRLDVVLLGISRLETAGWDALARMRDDAGLGSVPVILMSPRTLPADEVRGYGLGVAAYVQKPFTAEEIVEAVRDVIRV